MNSYFYINLYVYIYIHIYSYPYIYIHMYRYIYIYIYLCVHVYKWICIFIYIFVYVYANKYSYTSTCRRLIDMLFLYLGPKPVTTVTTGVKYRLLTTYLIKNACENTHNTYCIVFLVFEKK